MSLKFAIEKLPPIWPDIMRLASAHWMETEGYRHGQEFAPDAARYFAFNEMEAFGGPFYTMFTARDGGRMVGYAGLYVTSSMHSQKPIATEDTWFLEKDYRKGRNALEFYKFIEADCRRRGVVEIGVTTKLTHPSAARIVEYLGYEEVSRQYSKHLVYNQASPQQGIALRGACADSAMSDQPMELSGENETSLAAR